jgi:hypothetical protein
VTTEVFAQGPSSTAGTGPSRWPPTELLPDQTVPNLVTAKLGSGGKLSISNTLGSTDVVADLVADAAGWYDVG